MGKVRNKRLDIIKALGILLVTLGHTGIEPASSFVNLFHVGVFFAISGILFKENYTDSFSNLLDCILKKIKTLYIPFVLYNIVFLFFRNSFILLGILEGTMLTYREILVQISKILTMTAGEQLLGPCWFIRALFLLEISFSVIDFISKLIFKKYSRQIRVIISIILLIFGYLINVKSPLLPSWLLSNPLNVGTVFSSWSIFVFGHELYYCYKNNFEVFKDKINYKYSDFFSAGICFFLLIILNSFGKVSYADNMYPNILFFLVACFLGFGFLYGIAGIILKLNCKLTVFFVWLGRVTLEVLLMHLSGFKLVTVLYAQLRGLPKSVWKAFPQADTSIWFAYFFGGLLFSVCFSFSKRKIIGFIKNKFGKKKYIVLLLFASLLFLLPRTATTISSKVNSDFDYYLVFDEQYYLEHNDDLRKVYGDNPDYNTILSHFIEYGMDEGRQASDNFDPYYYQAEYLDLKEQFGSNMRLYYEHYMKYGYNEGRTGARAEEITYDAQIAISLENNKLINVSINSLFENKGTYELLAMDPYQSDLSYGVVVKDNIVLPIKDFKLNLTDINEKYVLVKKENGQYVQASNFAYISNIEYGFKNVDRTFEANNKKGLQMSAGMFEDAENLGVEHIFTNVILSLVMQENDANDAIVMDYKGKKYYFNSAEIHKLDSYFSELYKKKIVVTVGIITYFNEKLPSIYYPAAFEENSASFFALNTSTKEGAEFVEAFITFISERYDGSNEEYGLISNWVIGNEVNESGTYNYMGEKPLGEYLDEYTRTFRILHNIIKSNIPGANVYVPLEPWWGISSNDLTYGGREFLTSFAKKMNEEGDVNWGLAYHAYSYPLSDPKVLNDDQRTIDETGKLTLDGYFTTENENTITITMKNIDVLIEYMHKKEMLTSDGKVRSIILSEQGYTSNSNVYGKCEAQQAASMLYAYYKAESLSDIDAFIYFLQKDDKNASLGNSYYQFGLQSQENDEEIHKKLSYRIFKCMDKENSLINLSYFTTILGIDSWDSIIPNINSVNFNKTDNDEELELKDISYGNINIIPNQKYTGEEILPEIWVEFEGNPLINDVDYDVVYLDNIDSGNAKVVVVGLGEYSGILTSSFHITDN
ncbi:DUF5722 domain-containing protein [Bulleidia sp. HCP3S3_F2]|uniref:DUF5722 domain-containing protein n=1 Tax=unclassified Bulleidia TaxID=2704656 RepID=UPI003F8CD04E